MRVFLTGGTGYVGSAVLESLVRGGHHVDALVRNSVGAATVQGRGGHPVLGDLLQPASWADAAAAADGLAIDQLVRSPRARALGWTPTLHSVAGNVARLFEEWKRGKAA